MSIKSRDIENMVTVYREKKRLLLYKELKKLRSKNYEYKGTVSKA